jgi:hypothetical protein
MDFPTASNLNAAAHLGKLLGRLSRARLNFGTIPHGTSTRRVVVDSKCEWQL